MGKVLRIILGGLAVAITFGAAGAMLAEPFWAALFEQLGWNTATWVVPVLGFLSQRWFQFVLSGIVGAAIGSWAHWLATKLDRRRNVAPRAQARPDTRLRIRLAADGTFHQEACLNIERWQQTSNAISSSGNEGAPKLDLRFDTLAMTFQTPVEYERPIINTYGHTPPSVNIYPLGEHGAMFQFIDKVQVPQFEIWFPPVGYYDQQSQISLTRDAPVAIGSTTPSTHLHGDAKSA